MYYNIIYCRIFNYILSGANWQKFSVLENVSNVSNLLQNKKNHIGNIQNKNAQKLLIAGNAKGFVYQIISYSSFKINNSINLQLTLVSITKL